MANNIYIGNRYVPIFADPVEWNNLREYEPLTIVTYQGTAYTSRKTVPVGIELSNTEYWVVTGNYNAQVEQYRQDVLSYKEEVGDYVDTLNGAVDDIANMQPRLTSTENDINNIESVLSDVHKPLTMKNVIFIGDSYATPEQGWVYYAASYLGLPRANYYKSALGSTGFGYATGGVKFDTLLTNAYNAVDADFRANVSHVVVCGGANDVLATDQQVLEGIATFYDHMRTYFPKAKMCIGFIGNLRDSTKKHLLQQRYCDYNCASTRTMSYLNGVEAVLHNYDYIGSDNVHPTADGQRALGKAIAGALLNGSWVQTYPRRNTSNIGTTTRYVIESLEGNIVRLSTNNTIRLSYSTAISLNDNTAIDLGTLDFKYIWGNYYQELSAPCYAHAKGQGGAWVVVPGCVVIYENKLQFVPIIKAESGGESYFGITELVISRWAMTNPTMIC